MDMFTYSINNPNNININVGNDNIDKCHFVPFGHRCTSAISIQAAGLRNQSLPFDWTIPALPNRIKAVLEQDFADFVPDVPRTFFNKYGLGLAHFNGNITEGIDQYNRRLDRFRNIMNDNIKKKYFVYINEDYLYNNEYRKDKFNNTVFNEMLELENFLKQKYPQLKYNIIYFNFMKHSIPKNSNIVNIVLKTTSKLFDKESGSYSILTPFRNKCGSILQEIFNIDKN